ncbi:MAG TPA: hypothetical protein VHD81_04260 [Mycobacteriales bacterium]|nr:hypothetical protein [Mycobacteriales bacterium]
MTSLLASASAAPTKLWDEIAPRLFMGGTPDPGEPDPGLPFDAVVTLYAFAPPADWLVQELRYGFYDAGIDVVDLDRVRAAANWAFDRWQRGDRVLIRCQAGLNRSGLVMALVLIRAGFEPSRAIQRIRARRSRYALCNDEFADWLLAGRPSQDMKE